MLNVRHGSATLLLLILHGGTCVAERRCSVEEFGAVADDGRSDHAAILAALRACGGAAGGEIVMHGPGVYESAPTFGPKPDPAPPPPPVEEDEATRDRRANDAWRRSLMEQAAASVERQRANYADRL